MDCVVHGVAKSRIRLSDLHSFFLSSQQGKREELWARVGTAHREPFRALETVRSARSRQEFRSLN